MFNKSKLIYILSNRSHKTSIKYQISCINSDIHFLDYPCRKLRLMVENKSDIILKLDRLLFNNRVVYKVESGLTICNGKECSNAFLFSWPSDDKDKDGAWLVCQNVITVYILDNEI